MNEKEIEKLLLSIKNDILKTIVLVNYQEKEDMAKFGGSEEDVGWCDIRQNLMAALAGIFNCKNGINLINNKPQEKFDIDKWLKDIK